MPRIEIELTSLRDDGSWTWRAAGAREPRGDLDGALLAAGASVGDVLRVETEQHLDGVTVVAVLPARGARAKPDLLEVFGNRNDEPTVTTRLVGGRRSRDADRDRRPRREGRGGDRRGRDGERRGRDGDRRGRDGERRGRDGERRGRDGDRRADRRDSRPRAERSQRPNESRRRRNEAPAQPRAPRLRPRRTHRNAALAELPEEQRLLGRILLDGGVPGLRSEVQRQNEAAKAAGEPEIPAHLLLSLGERLHRRLHAADWMDRAEAAESGLADLDLRDLRSVVVAAESGARGEDGRALAERLRTGLTERVEREHEAWLAEVAQVLGEGRVVRALRLSSRPPKAGAPMPRDLLERLAHAASEGLTAETGQDRWGTLLEAVAMSPVHERVVPTGLPDSPSEELLELVRRVSMRVPAIAASLGVDPTPPPANRRRRRPSPTS